MKNPITQLVKAVTLRNTKRSDKWPTARKHHLESQPFCKYCGGVANLEVHHIDPFHLDPEQELDQTNLITLCEAIGKQCHLRHGHLGNWKSFNPNIVKEAVCTEPVV